MRMHGEGDHPKGGGGVTGSACAFYPSTMLRMVPLPTGFAGREERPPPYRLSQLRRAKKTSTATPTSTQKATTPQNAQRECA
jgi:hypothetical protein